MTSYGDNYELPLPIQLPVCASIEELSFSYFDVNHAMPECWEAFPNLKSLSMPHNDFTGPIPDSLWESVNLEYLDLWDNDLTGSFQRVERL